MAEQYIDLTPQNLAEEHLCCIIRAKPNPGIAAKCTWLSARLVEGHVFRKLDVKDCVFIEYAPLETAWVPVVGGQLAIYLLPVGGKHAKRAWLRQRAACVLHRGRAAAREVRRLHARRTEAEGMAFRPELCTPFWLRNGRCDARRLRAARAQLGRNKAALRPERDAAHRRQQGSLYTTICSARSSPRASRSCRSIAQRRAYPPALSRWTASRRQNRSPVCSTTGRCFTAARFRPSTSSTPRRSNGY